MRRLHPITLTLLLALVSIAAVGLIVLLSRVSIIQLPRPIARLIGPITSTPPGPPATPKLPQPPTAIVPPRAPVAPTITPPTEITVAPQIITPSDQRLILRPLPALLSPPPHLQPKVASTSDLDRAAEALQAWSAARLAGSQLIPFAQPPQALLTQPLLPWPTEPAALQAAWEIQLPSLDARHEASLHGDIPTDLRAILGDSTLRTRDQIDLYAADLALPLLQPKPSEPGLSVSLLAGLRVAATDPSRESESPNSGYLPLVGPSVSYRWSRRSSTSISLLADVNQPMSAIPEWRVMHTWRLTPASTLSLGYTHFDASFDTSPAPLTLKRDAATILFSLEF